MSRAPSVRLRSRGPEDTRAIAAAAAEVLRPGDVVALTGDLGAGKTCFVQGAARALGVEQRVTSPTYVLVRTYDGRVPVLHCDVYRLNQLSEVRDLGDEVGAPHVLTFVEWGDAIASVLPDDRLEVELQLATDSDGADPDHRSIVARGHGAWGDRLYELIEACAAWRVGGGDRGAAVGDG